MPGFDPFGQWTGVAFQVGIDGGVPVGMIQIQGESVAGGRCFDATHMARSGAAIIANFANATVNDSTIVDHDAPAGMKDDGARAGGALVEREDHASHCGLLRSNWIVDTVL